MNERWLQGQVALVTGGGRGLGLAIGEALADAGAAVALVARSGPEVRDAACSILERGGRALALTADVTRLRTVEAAVDEAERRLGAIDLLVNAAGTCAAIEPVSQADPVVWQRDVENSLLGTFLCTRAVLPHMTSRGRGRIVNVSSYAANRPTPNISAYGAAKAAVVHLTGSLAAETRDTGITVFAVTTGPVRTELTRRLTESEQGRTWLPTIPSDRWLPAERIGELVVFLATGRADPLSGRFLHVLDDVEELARRAEEVEREDLYVLRLRT